ncbi:MAG: non-homologous end-joining DNA ligase [Candidatus Parvarchaeota archaeon]|nr:non-homologous end-joining DNA ligase [Candidatus Jingweiarchaeum tengchongense]
MEKDIKPMLAYSSSAFDDEDWICEIKLDGTRTICYFDADRNHIRFLNRRMIDFTHKYPEIYSALPNAINARQVILDGEIVTYNKEGKPDFYSLQMREHVDDKIKIDVLSKTIPATFVVFDILYLNGEELIDKPLIERKKILRNVLKDNPFIRISEEFNGINCKKLFEEIKKIGFEGLMMKKKDSPYLIGKRSKFWLKIKNLKTIDAVIIGYTEGKGKREGYFGALVLGCYHKGKLFHIGRVGTGWDDEKLREIKNKLDEIAAECPVKDTLKNWQDYEKKYVVKWVQPRIVCEVKFMEITKDLMLRAPSFIRLREDKDAKECVLEENL